MLASLTKPGTQSAFTPPFIQGGVNEKLTAFTLLGAFLAAGLGREMLMDSELPEPTLLGSPEQQSCLGWPTTPSRSEMETQTA